MDGITISDNGITFNGPDAVDYFRAKTLWSSLKLYNATGIIPTRGVTITRMMKLASHYTGKAYKRGQGKLAQEDMKVLLDAYLASLPIDDERRQRQHHAR